MQFNQSTRAKAASSGVNGGAVRVFDSPMDTKEIFRALILDEVRTGRLSRSRRKRIVQYAAHLGISGVEVGKMIETCRSTLLQEEDNAQECPFELVPADRPKIPTQAKIAIVLGIALLVDFVVLKWLVFP